MIKQNSGIVYSFKLDHDLGFGFAEFYDFTDVSVFDGRFVFVYNLVSSTSAVELSEITNSGIALGPISLFRPINTRGMASWKKLSQSNEYLMEEWPVAKSLRANPHLHDDWNLHDKWFIESEKHDPLQYVPYEKVRRLETLVLSSTQGVKILLSMKVLIDLGKPVADFYDLSDQGNRNHFIRLINTYYPVEQTRKLLKQLNTVN
jgi:hypothetical protein